MAKRNIFENGFFGGGRRANPNVRRGQQRALHQSRHILLSEREATKGAFGFGVYDSYGAGSARIRLVIDFGYACDLDKVSASGGGIVPTVRLKEEAGAN
ncbi:MAG: hypothetical protein IJL24_09715 [Treponema sp.]|nr:hypothetical protein [Treponema sp.]